MADLYDHPPKKKGSVRRSQPLYKVTTFSKEWEVLVEHVDLSFHQALAILEFWDKARCGMLAGQKSSPLDSIEDVLEISIGRCGTKEVTS